MKKIILLFALFIGTYGLQAQNTFPANGNVGIGTTDTRNGLLTLRGEHINLLRLENVGLGKEATMRFRSKSTSGGTLHSDISLYATGNNQGFLGFKVPHNNTANSGYDMVINNFGNIGIGTTNPLFKLHIHQSGTIGGSPKGRIHITNTDTGSSWSDGLQIIQNGIANNYKANFLLRENGQMGFWTNNLERLTVSNNGNVGIGTTNPGSKLHIQNGATNYTWTPILGTAGIFESSSANRAFLTIVGKSTAQSELWFGDENTQNSGRVRYENSTDDLEFWTNGTEKMAITSLGNVGIGTTTPISALEVNGDISLARSNKIKFLDAVGGNNRAFIRSTNGENGDYNSLIFAIGGGHESMIIKANSGNVGIGTKNPSEKLTVKGKILCGEVKVVMESTIPADYVFQKYYTGTSALKADYVMPSLEEVEAFTKANHHLPEVPSAATIKEEGLQLKEMTTLLLQKVEELTLYTIEQEKRIKSLEAKLVEKN